MPLVRKVHRLCTHKAAFASKFKRRSRVATVFHSVSPIGHAGACGVTRARFASEGPQRDKTHAGRKTTGHVAAAGKSRSDHPVTGKIVPRECQIGSARTNFAYFGSLRGGGNSIRQSVAGSHFLSAQRATVRSSLGHVARTVTGRNSRSPGFVWQALQGVRPFRQ